MISGALLLKRDISVDKKYWWRILRIVIALCVTFFLYDFYELYFSGKKFDFSDSLKLLLLENAAYKHLWFLYHYIGILAMMPFFCKMVRNMKVNDYLLFILFALFFYEIVPAVQYLAYGRTSTYIFAADFFTSVSVPCFIAGHFLENVLEEKNFTLKNALISIAAGILAVFLACFMAIYAMKVSGDKSSEKFFGFMIIVPAMTLYFCAKVFFLRVDVGTKMKKTIRFFGQAVFRIYLFEKMFEDVLRPVLFSLRSYLPALPACFLYLCVVLVVGALVINCLRLFPFVRKII